MKPYDPPAHTSTSYRWVGLRRASQDRLRRCRTLPPGEAEINVRKTARYAGEKTDPLHFASEQPLPVIYKGLRLDCGFRVDLIVAGAVVVEIKAVERLAPVHDAQLLTYLRPSGWKVGLLINFNVPVLREGIRRRVLGLEE